MDEIFKQNTNSSSSLAAATKEIKLDDDEETTSAKPSINIKPQISISDDNLSSTVNHKPSSVEVKVTILKMDLDCFCHCKNQKISPSLKLIKKINLIKIACRV